MVSGNGENRLAIHFCIVESVEQMNAAGPGGGQTYAKSARILGVTTGHECGGFFMSNLNETNIVLALS